MDFFNRDFTKSCGVRRRPICLVKNLLLFGTKLIQKQANGTSSRFIVRVNNYGASSWFIKHNTTFIILLDGKRIEIMR